MEWIQANYAALLAIVLGVLRVAESIAIVAKADKVVKIIAVLKEFFRFG